LPFLALLSLIDPMAGEGWNRPIIALRRYKNGDPKAATIM
jgi:hypothetical protein